MENIVDITEQQSQNKENNATKTSRKEIITFRHALSVCIVFCVISIILFLWGRLATFNFSDSIQENVFGTFGDFIGGFLGTFVALYSVYLLVKTLQNQIVTNESVIQTNDSVIETNKKLLNQTQLQIFDSRFSTLLDLYKDAIDSYINNENQKGRAVFENIVDDFKNTGLTNKTEYKRRSIGAVSEYVRLYVSHRQNLSIHLRMLYLLTKLTAEEKIHEQYRVSYAKSIRGQLSENELLIIRYNCLSQYGKKMRTYVNKFNLIKHLPIMSLLEFTRWRNIIVDESYCSAIDQLTITLRKIMLRMLDSEGANNHDYKVSSRILFNFDLNEMHNNLSITFKFQKNKKNGGAIKRPLEEKAFDCLSENEIKEFLEEIFIELFIYSNFFCFNGDDNHMVTTSIVENTKKVLQISIHINNKKSPLALADRQVLPS